MDGQEFKIIFKQDQAFLTNEKPISLENAGLKNTIAIQKGFKYPAYWIIRVIRYIENEKKIFCEVLLYELGETEFGINQKLLSDKLNALVAVNYSKIDTGGLFKTVLGDNSGLYTSSRNFTPDKTMHNHEIESTAREPYKHIITETFFVPLKNVRFILGGVTFNKKLKQHPQSIEFTITNYDIREEFDAVKNYFSNVLQTKEIQVLATVELLDNKVTSINAKSDEIEKINKNLIDNVKFDFVTGIKKKISVDIDKNLFTMEEYFDTFTDEKVKSNTFYNDESDFFNDLVNVSNTKHYQHLRFLSSKHSHSIMKLRFVHKPFSFIFLIQGERNDHVIWETLDTKEATYIWHIEKDRNALKLAIQKLESIINLIKVQGKTVYINTADEPFRRIVHDYSNPLEGFLKWKGEIESILT